MVIHKYLLPNFSDIFNCEEFSRILRALSSTSAPVTPSQPQAIHPLQLGAALEAEKRHGRTTETDPCVQREEYVYFQGPYILVTDQANVHKPIMVREFPAGSSRKDGLWPMFWAGREGNCPFIRPSQPKASLRTSPAVITPAQKGHNAKPKVALEDNSQIVNRVIREQPASGIINSSTAFSAIRSTTTCGSNVTSAALSGTIRATGSLPRQLRDFKTRLTSVVAEDSGRSATNRMDPPPMKKRRVETTLREQVVKTKMKPNREGYCENCKERYDYYEEVFTIKRPGLNYSTSIRDDIGNMQGIIRILFSWMSYCRNWNGRCFKYNQVCKRKCLGKRVSWRDYSIALIDFSCNCICLIIAQMYV